MAETIDVTPDGGKDPQSSVTVTHVLYGLHALAPFTMLLLALVAVASETRPVCNLRRSREARTKSLNSGCA